MSNVKKKILVVDDARFTRNMLKKIKRTSARLRIVEASSRETGTADYVSALRTPSRRGA